MELKLTTTEAAKTKLINKTADFIKILGYKEMAKEIRTGKQTAQKTLNCILSLRMNQNQPPKWKFMINRALEVATKENI